MSPPPAEGDWLGTPFLRFERHPPFADLTVDRPEAKNALTQAMYFGIRYAVRRVDADPELALVDHRGRATSSSPVATSASR